jgi:ribonuclease G
LAEWLYEEGIGENRAILVEGGDERVAMSPGHGYAARGAAYPLIVEAAIELPGPRAGAVVAARLTSAAGSALLHDGSEAMVSPIGGLTEGASFRAELLREAIPERGRPKPPKVRPTELPLRPGPSLAERIGCLPGPAHGLDRFEQAGWSELLEQARTGEIAFPGGALRMSVTPAMTLFDVDGSLPIEDLAEAGAAAAARAIRRLGVTGSIGIDLPTLPRERRQRAAAAVDAILPQPFERTAVNGFGFLQIVRRRERPSIPEIVQGDPLAAAARALLRRAGRATGAATLHAAPPLIAYLERRPDWLAALARMIGGEVGLRAEPGLAISAGHVH